MLLAVYGSGGLGKTILDFAYVVEHHSHTWDEIVFIDDVTNEKSVLGVPVFPFEAFKEKYTPSPEVSVFVAIGEPKSRAAVCANVQNSGYRFARLIHPNAEISPSAVIGDDVVIGNCFICPLVKIGDHAIIANRCTVGHDSSVGSYTVMNEGVFVGGFTEIGEMVYIGANAALKDRIRVENNAAVAMGAAVFKDVPEGFVAFGNPARNLRRGDDAKLF